MLDKRALALIVLSLLFVIPVTSSAQDQPRINSLEIAIWPEYDRPGALVIYKLRLAEGAPTPAVVTLPIPASAGDPHAVAAWYPDGSLDDNVTWTATQQGDRNLIEVMTVTNGVWLEFYDEISSSGVDREYAFTWAGDLDVDSLSFDVMHPVGAVDLRIEPEGESYTGSDGIPRQTLSPGSQGAGEPFNLELSYRKPTAFTGELPTIRSNPALSQFEVALWPEYDRVATLVILRGRFSPEVALPASVTLPIPVTAGDPTAVAFLGEDSRLYSTDYEYQVEGDWAWITIPVEGPGFQLEYYDGLTIEGTRRTYTFTWPGAFTAGSYNYEIQQPVGATGVQVTPGGGIEAGPDGLTYLRSGLGPQRAGSALFISLEYEKGTQDLSADWITSAPSIDRPSTTQGSTPDLSARLPYILGGFGLALIVLGVFLYLRVRGQKTATGKRARKRKPKPKRSGADLDAAAVFCHVCGAKASASDHFCRSCGTKLRQ